jgi:CheY-like chemotaxis protein
VSTDSKTARGRATILVVDDEADMRFLAKHILESSDLHVVAEAVDGHDALERYRELDPPPVPTVVLLDNQMPRKTGIEAAAEILAEAPDQIIVLFSAYLSDTILAEARRLGVAACVSKSDVADLPRIIEDLIASRA